MTFVSYADFKAPWEEAGDEVDGEKAKKLVYNSRKAEHEALEKVKERGEKLSEAEEALKVYKKAETDAARANETAVEKLTRERDEAIKAAEAAKTAKPEKSRETLLLEVALDKGLTKKQASRLVGETLEEIEKDADEYIAEHGIVKSDDSNNEENDGLRRTPTVVKTPGDPGGESTSDIGKAIDARRARNPLIA